MILQSLGKKELLDCIGIASKFGIEVEMEDFFMGAFEENRLLSFICGKLEKTATVKFVFVKGLNRGNGISTKLLEEFCGFAKEQGYEAVMVNSLWNGSAETRASKFLLKQGFGEFKRDKTVYTFPIEDFMDWGEQRRRYTRKLNGLRRWSEIPSYLRHTFTEMMEGALPKYLSPKPWLGKKVESLSYCYVTKGEIKVNSTMSEFMGELHLESLYCKKGYERALYQILLQIAIGCKRYEKKYQYINLTCINDASNNLFLNISKEWRYEERHSWVMKRSV